MLARLIEEKSIDWRTLQAWVAAGAVFGGVIPLLVFLSGTEILLILVSVSGGAGVGYALWQAAR